jgi:hypothetical protein
MLVKFAYGPDCWILNRPMAYAVIKASTGKNTMYSQWHILSMVTIITTQNNYRQLLWRLEARSENIDHIYS